MNFHVLKQSILFQGMEENEIEAMLKCLSAVSKTYGKGEFIFHVTDEINSVGIVLSGSITIEKEDFWGNRRIIEKAVPGALFGESYACIKGEPLMVSVKAEENTKVLFLNITRVLTVCSSACRFHTGLIRNLLQVLAYKNLNLTVQIDHITQKTIRERILSYLNYQVLKQGCYSFEIPFNRQQLADYLSADRSALSNELSKMRKEGLIRYKKNHFEIIV